MDPGALAVDPTDLGPGSSRGELFVALEIQNLGVAATKHSANRVAQRYGVLRASADREHLDRGIVNTQIGAS
jgi:hypothetical protein